jgi:cell division initiation protein
MDSTDNAASAIDSIDTVAFKVGLKGYNVDEVDEFLERLSHEVRQLRDLVQQQRQQLRQAAERISQLDVRAGVATGPVPATASASEPTGVVRTSSVNAPEQVSSMIALAQRFIEQAQLEAEAKAREFTTAAQERAREIVSEARSRAEDEVNRLNGLKQRLSEDVETLSAQLQAERTRIAQVLAEFTRWVETSLQAGASRTSALPAANIPNSPNSTPVTASTPSTAPLSPRPTQIPPPAPAPASLPTIGQVLKFDQSSRDER